MRHLALQRLLETSINRALQRLCAYIGGMGRGERPHTVQERREFQEGERVQINMPFDSLHTLTGTITGKRGVQGRWNVALDEPPDWMRTRDIFAHHLIRLGR